MIHPVNWLFNCPVPQACSPTQLLFQVVWVCKRVSVRVCAQNHRTHNAPAALTVAPPLLLFLLFCCFIKTSLRSQGVKTTPAFIRAPHVLQVIKFIVVQTVSTDLWSVAESLMSLWELYLTSRAPGY